MGLFLPSMLAKHKVGSSTLLTRSTFKPVRNKGFFFALWLVFFLLPQRSQVFALYFRCLRRSLLVVLRQHPSLEHWGCIFQLSRFEFPSGGQPSTRDYKDRAAEA